MPDKIQIVLDADVIIHFSQGGYLHLLPKVIPDCSFVVLSIVRNELRHDSKNELDNHITYLKNISLIEYNPIGEERREFARLTSLSGFVQKVREAGSILPNNDLETYYCDVF